VKRSTRHACTLVAKPCLHIRRCHHIRERVLCKQFLGASELGGSLNENPTVQTLRGVFAKFHKIVVERFKCHIFIYS
jgi:hypothetical protein